MHPAQYIGTMGFIQRCSKASPAVNSRFVIAGTTLPRLLGVSLAAEGIQCDSHLPGTSSVLLHSQPASQTAKQASQLQAPLHLQLQVCMIAGLTSLTLFTAINACCSSRYEHQTC